MVSSFDYELIHNNKVKSRAKNKIHTSYFSFGPQSTYYLHIGSGVDDLPFSAGGLEDHKAYIGSIQHIQMTRNVVQDGGYTYYTLSTVFSGTVPSIDSLLGEVSVHYASSNARMISRAVFKDGNGNPTPIEVLPEDSVGIRINMRVKKEVAPVNVNINISNDRVVSGKLYEVNLDDWFSNYISRPLPSTLYMSIFNATDLAIDDKVFNTLSGTIQALQTQNCTYLASQESDKRIDSYTANFPPTVEKTFKYIGLHSGAAGSSQSAYYSVVILDEDVTLSEAEEATISLKVVQTEGDLNGNT